MADEKDLKRAQQVYANLRQALDADDWQYTPNDDELSVTLKVRGEDLPIDVLLKVYAEEKMFTILSHLGFTVPEDKRIDLALAVSVVNRGMAQGGFDYNIRTGRIVYRMSNSYIGTELSGETLLFMLYVTVHTVEKYNDKFFMLAKGMTTIEQFIQVKEE